MRTRSPQAERRAALLATESDVRAVVMDRDGHACIICGTSRDVTRQHILPRGAGGTSRPTGPELSVVLCGSGTTRCHGRVEREGREDGWAYRLGYLVRHGPHDGTGDPDATHLVWVHAEHAWYELFGSGVRTIRPDLRPPADGDLAALGDVPRRPGVGI